MGNDILKQKHSQYIQTKKLVLSSSTTRLDPDSFEKVFGKQEQSSLLKKNHTVSYLVPERSINEVIREENTFQEEDMMNFLPFRQTQGGSSINTHNTESINMLQQQLNRMKASILNQEFNSKDCSPIKKQNKREQYINQTYTRNRKHYFKLKGSDKKIKEYLPV